MKNTIDMKVSGIKCDNSNCDFIDTAVQAEDYGKWVNEPCPKCGANLLTEKDYRSVKILLKMTNVLNKVFPKRKDSSRDVNVKIDMNGTGDIDFKVIDK